MVLPTDEFEPLSLREGDQIDVAVSAEGGMAITRSDSMGAAQARVQLPYPKAGFGGGGVMLSPSERYLVVHSYSGQCEETFCLLDLEQDIRLIAAPDDYPGEYASYAFPQDESRLLMALPESMSEWWQEWQEDGLELDDDGIAFRRFASLILCDCDSGTIAVSQLIIVPTVDQPLHTDSYDPDLNPRFVSANTLCLSMPWGDTTISLPQRASTIRVHYPPPR